MEIPILKCNMTGTMIIQGVVLGTVVATVACFIIWMKHRPVKVATHANQYLDKNTVEITDGYDHFVNSNVEKWSINKN